MNLRTETIWMAGVMMIVTIVVSACVFIVFSGVPIYMFAKNSAIDALIFWLLTGSPSFISFAVALKLKHGIPINVLQASTILYAIWYAYGAYHLFFEPPYWGAILYFFWTGIALMFPAMIVVWICTLVLDRHYAKQSLVKPENTTE